MLLLQSKVCWAPPWLTESRTASLQFGDMQMHLQPCHFLVLCLGYLVYDAYLTSLQWYHYDWEIVLALSETQIMRSTPMYEWGRWSMFCIPPQPLDSKWGNNKDAAPVLLETPGWRPHLCVIVLMLPLKVDKQFLKEDTVDSPSQCTHNPSPQHQGTTEQ